MLLLGVILVPTIFYLIALQNALEAIDAPMRPVSPGLVWLQFIPIFNLVWMFFLVNYLRNGYAKMGAAGRLRGETSAGYGVGIGMACSSVACAIPGINMVAWIPAIVLWILEGLRTNRGVDPTPLSSSAIPSPNVMCKRLGVTRGGYYAWQRREPSARALRGAQLSEHARDVHAQSRG